MQLWHKLVCLGGEDTPNRIIKESINESRSLADCTFFTQDLYKRLITYADDYGRFNADTQIMLSRLYPRDTDIINHDDIITGLIELCGVGKICFYTSQPKKDVYGCFPNWAEHQRLRDSKSKCPEPHDTSINDWYLRMFVPMQMKIQIIERDHFKCQECKASFKVDGLSAKKLIKLRTGLIHFDHVVPVNQGGRATLENLRLLCEKCNLSRKRFFNYEEILQFAESCGEFPQISASIKILPPNPIQSESNPNPIRESESEYITAQHLTLTKDEYDKLVSEYGQSIVDEKIEYAKNYKKLKNYTSLYLTLNNWLKKDVTASGNPFA